MPINRGTRGGGRGGGLNYQTHPPRVWENPGTPHPHRRGGGGGLLDSQPPTLPASHQSSKQDTSSGPAFRYSRNSVAYERSTRRRHYLSRAMNRRSLSHRKNHRPHLRSLQTASFWGKRKPPRTPEPSLPPQEGGVGVFGHPPTPNFQDTHQPPPPVPSADRQAHPCSRQPDREPRNAPEAFGQGDGRRRDPRLRSVLYRRGPGDTAPRWATAAPRHSPT